MKLKAKRDVAYITRLNKIPKDLWIPKGEEVEIDLDDFEVVEGQVWNDNGKRSLYKPSPKPIEKLGEPGEWNEDVMAAKINEIIERLND